MTEPAAPAPEKRQPPSAAVAGDAQSPASESVWQRLRRHKVAQWTLAYAAAAYTLLHVVEMVTEAMDWPHFIARILTFVLALGVPVVVTLAWYHGAKGLRRVSAAELTIIALLGIVAGSVLWAVSRTRTEYAASTLSTSSTAPRTSIAVMPFANLTGDASKDYLGDGMSEELIDTLTKVPGLTVPSRTSSFSYKGRNTELRQIGKDLGVGTILEGSVRSAGTTIRVTAQLIDAQSDRHLWSQTYNREFTDLFKLQDELATAIVNALQVKLNGVSPTSVSQAPPTRDVEAYNLYLQAKSVNERGTEQSMHIALDLYGQALARDPKFARALSGRSAARGTFLMQGYPLANALEDAERDAQQALALDPSLGEAHTALGEVSEFRADWLKAEASYRAALAVDFRNPDVHSRYAAQLTATGQLQHGYSEANEAYRLAPAGPEAILMTSVLSTLLGLDAQAVKYANLAVAVGVPPTVVPLPQIYAYAAVRGARYTEAADRMVETLADPLRDAGGTEVMRLIYSALADPTRKPAARVALQELVHKLGASNIEPNSRKDFIIAFVALDALDQAYALSTQLVDEFKRSGTGGGPGWGYLWLPQMRPFRQDPRFQEFVSRLNLIDYWKHYGPPDDCDLNDGKLTCH